MWLCPITTDNILLSILTTLIIRGLSQPSELLQHLTLYIGTMSFLALEYY